MQGLSRLLVASTARDPDGPAGPWRLREPDRFRSGYGSDGLSVSRHAEVW
jgi:hypothetical protein